MVNFYIVDVIVGGVVVGGVEGRDFIRVGDAGEVSAHGKVEQDMEGFAEIEVGRAVAGSSVMVDNQFVIRIRVGIFVEVEVHGRFFGASICK